MHHLGTLAFSHHGHHTSQITVFRHNEIAHTQPVTCRHNNIVFDFITPLGKLLNGLDWFEPTGSKLELAQLQPLPPQNQKQSVTEEGLKNDIITQARLWFALGPGSDFESELIQVKCFGFPCFFGSLRFSYLSLWLLLTATLTSSSVCDVLARPQKEWSTALSLKELAAHWSL